ncbi:MAG TPA: hypothetical protein DCP53_06885 [Elusimicrobia bacterium]|nr:hypothetical protein [Elusimicrobiota bacterium]
MENIKFLIFVLLSVFVVCGCASPMKKPALNAITQARLDIDAAKNNIAVKSERLSLRDAESSLVKANLSFAGKDYTDAKSFAEKASEEAKSIIKEAKELKEKRMANERKASEKKKIPIKKSLKK